MTNKERQKQAKENFLRNKAIKYKNNRNYAPFIISGFIILFLALIIFNPQSKNIKNNMTVKKIKAIPLVKIEETNNIKKIEEIFKEFKILYNELLSFKNKPDFKIYGFGQDGPYYKWLTKVINLKENPDAKLLLQKGILVGELEQLGYAYVNSKGKETELTKLFNITFSNAISAKPIEEIEIVSGNDNYNKLKVDYKLFGKWKIVFTIVNMSHPYEIYKKGNKYKGLIPLDNFKIETLEKKGNRYFIKGNSDGEYFIIDSNMEMTLFDSYGELASDGIIAIKD